jgi:hypothetical protein
MKEIKAREGYYLTQVAEVGDDRLFITALKGANINESDWREAIEEEKIAFEEAQKELLDNNGSNMDKMVEE